MICAYKAAKHVIPDPSTGEGDHDWFQKGADIWCLSCGADYDDESRTHPMFARPAATEQLGLFGGANG